MRPNFARKAEKTYTPDRGGGRGRGLEFPESVTNQEEKVCI